MDGYAKTVSLTDYGAEAADIDRRRKMAELLQQQALTPIEQQTAGGRVIPISWTQGLAKLLQGGVGAYKEAQAAQQSKDLTSRRSQAMAAALSGMPTAQTTEMQGSPEDTAQFGMAPQMQTTQPTMQQNASWLGQLAQLGPDATQIGSTMLGMQQKADENEANRQARTQDKILALEAAASNAALSREERAARAAEAAQLRRDLQQSQQQFAESAARQAAADRAAMAREARADRNAAAQAGRVPPGYRMLPDGNMQAIPGGPADVKTQKQAEQVDSGRGTVSGLVTQLRDSYDQLANAGGITDPNAGKIGNLAAGIASSGPGQFAGRLFGTQNQSLRNSIAQTRPLLLNAIKQATGMSAKQMDSNAELKLYLSAATDPTLDIESNRKALDMLDKLYGLSGATHQPSAGASGGWDDSKERRYQELLRKKKNGPQ